MLGLVTTLIYYNHLNINSNTKEKLLQITVGRSGIHYKSSKFSYKLLFWRKLMKYFPSKGQKQWSQICENFANCILASHQSCSMPLGSKEVNDMSDVGLPSSNLLEEDNSWNFTLSESSWHKEKEMGIGWNETISTKGNLNLN